MFNLIPKLLIYLDILTTNSQPIIIGLVDAEINWEFGAILGKHWQTKELLTVLFTRIMYFIEVENFDGLEEVV